MEQKKLKQFNKRLRPQQLKFPLRRDFFLNENFRRQIKEMQVFDKHFVLILHYFKTVMFRQLSLYVPAVRLYFTAKLFYETIFTTCN